MSINGYKTISSVVAGVAYVAGLLMGWWESNAAAESFIVLFFGIGAGHKVVKRRRAKRKSIEYQESPHRDDPRRYDSIEDLMKDRDD